MYLKHVHENLHDESEHSVFHTYSQIDIDMYYSFVLISSNVNNVGRCQLIKSCEDGKNVLFLKMLAQGIPRIKTLAIAFRGSGGYIWLQVLLPMLSLICFII
jgi:hypothetical protein